jgi:hypothetical protein
MPLPVLPAILTLLSLATLRKRKGTSSARSDASDYRTRFLDAVRGELGVSDPSVYYDSALGYQPTQDLSWCGIFVLAMLHRVGLALGIRWEVGKGFLFRLPTTEQPKPGDLFYQHDKNHHGVVESVKPDGSIVTLNGNSAGGQVARVVRRPETIAAYYSIAPLIAEAQS